MESPGTESWGSAVQSQRHAARVRGHTFTRLRRPSSSRLVPAQQGGAAVLRLLATTLSIIARTWNVEGRVPRKLTPIHRFFRVLVGKVVA